MCPLEKTLWDTLRVVRRLVNDIMQLLSIVFETGDQGMFQ